MLPPKDGSVVKRLRVTHKDDFDDLCFPSRCPPPPPECIACTNSFLPVLFGFAYYFGLHCMACLVRNLLNWGSLFFALVERLPRGNEISFSDMGRGGPCP